MAQTRKQKMIDLLMEEIDDLEELLIETPHEITAEEYQRVIMRVEFLRETLRKLLEQKGI